MAKNKKRRRAGAAVDLGDVIIDSDAAVNTTTNHAEFIVTEISSLVKTKLWRPTRDAGLLKKDYYIVYGFRNTTATGTYFQLYDGFELIPSQVLRRKKGMRRSRIGSIIVGKQRLSLG